VPRQHTGCSAGPAALGALSGHVRCDVAMYLFFLGDRSKEKLWVQILYHLSIASLNLFASPNLVMS
jgi:hypothetical protein